ncbi:MAG: hypothetical protein M3Q70_02655 [bacterium]|nr:hypothetical protein [bacterium]
MAEIIRLPRVDTSSVGDPLFTHPESRDDQLGELFRAFLPEMYDDLSFDDLLNIATLHQGTKVHEEMKGAAMLFQKVVKARLLREIERRKDNYEH